MNIRIAIFFESIVIFLTLVLGWKVIISIVIPMAIEDVRLGICISASFLISLITFILCKKYKINKLRTIAFSLIPLVLLCFILGLSVIIAFRSI